MTYNRSERLLFIILALLGALVITRGVVAQPGFTDAFYHFNAANRLVSGQGLTDPYLWTYVAAPDKLPAPSHLYWMPLTSLTAALGMGLLNAPGSYAAAQWPFALMLAATACVGFWLGGKLGGTRRHAWVAGLITLFSGFYTRFWGATDTFAPYALVGSLCLAFLALAMTDDRHPVRWFALSGAMAALGHLARADGLLLLMVGWVVILWPWQKLSVSRRFIGILVITLAYVVVMSPWFIRNLNAMGSPLPLGGTQAVWLTEYNDLFNYPPNASAATFFANGVSILFASRWEALTNNFGTFIAVEGLIIMTPLMLVGLWQRRNDAFLRGFWLYALGLHLAMTFIFPFPGYRGGLLHSATALVPWWAALGVVGLDDCIDWIARYRRRWNAKIAKTIFSIGLVALAIFLSVFIALPNRVPVRGLPNLYRELSANLPPDARVMINDPAQLYYYTGFGGVVLPNATPDVIPAIAHQYGVKYLVIEEVTPDGQASDAASPKLWPLLTAPPAFLTAIPLDIPNARLYEIRD